MSTEAARLYDCFLSVFNRMEDGVMLIDPDGTLLKANPACLKLHGLEAENAFLLAEKNKDHFILYDLDHEEIPLERWPFIRVLNKESFDHEELILFRKSDGKSFYASFSGQPEFDENGEFVVGIVYIRLITESVIAKKSLQSEIERGLVHKKDLDLALMRLDKEKMLLQAIIDTIPVMIVIYDQNVSQVILNKAVGDITGWSNNDLVRGNIMELAYPDPEYRQEVYGFMKSLTPGFRDLLMCTKDGRTIKTSWANVKLADGRQVGVGIDISERKKLEEELLQAKEKAEKENLIQSAFIQNISHEVRTPMNSILGFTELLQNLHLGNREREYLESITVNGKQLLRLIDDIVDFSRLDKNEMSLLKKDIRIGEFFRQIQGQFSGLKEKYNKQDLEIVYVEPKGNLEGIALYTDVGRLRQVLMNLISNSLKYTNKGKIELGYEIRKDQGDVLFYVKDTGIGIRKEDHARVFERFYRFHDPAQSEFRGTGLGLAICKHLVRLMGGDIWFDSEHGKGSTFFFTHPYSEKFDFPEDLFTKKKKENDQAPGLDGRTILIVEDDEYSYQLMKAMINGTEARIIWADTGKKAVDIVKQTPVDLVFLDIRLPEMDGYQVIGEIKAMNLKVPVIALTAHALPEDKEKSRRAGFDYHATKPVSMSELYRLLNKYLG